MKFKLVFATATAVGLLMATGAVYADSNISTIYQNGTGNAAQAIQDGTGNYAGVGTATGNGSMQQRGDDNSLLVNQTGNSNNVGYANQYAHSVQVDKRPTMWLPSNVISIDQINDNNTIFIDQSGNSNEVDGVSQTAGSVGNNVKIKQSGTGSAFHYVGTIEQIETGTVSNNITVTQEGGAYRGNSFLGGNMLYQATQNGGENSFTLHQNGKDNIVTTLSQSGTDNTASVTQGGVPAGGVLTGDDLNWVDLVSQTATSTGGNNIDIALYGHNNGRGYDDLGTFSNGRGAAAAASSVASATQGGNNDALTFRATGDFNLFNFAQTGDNNGITTTITGSSNEVAVRQADGGNTAGIDIAGSGNILGVDQSGLSGAAGNNSATVNINGNDNNGISTASAFSNTGTLTDTNGGTVNVGAGNALYASATLTPGLIIQKGGSDNTVTLNVGYGPTNTTLSSSSDNLFAMVQDGSANAISGRIYGGSGNQAAVVQVGSSNTASFTQVGSNNNVGISQ